MDTTTADAILDAIAEVTEPLHQRIRTLEIQLGMVGSTPRPADQSTPDAKALADAVRARLLKR